MPNIPPLKIMIADDDYDDRETLKFLFDKNELFTQLNCFDNGADVLEEILKKGIVPQILLIDRQMPKLSGIEVVEELLASEVGSDIKIFVISSVIDEEAKQFYKANSQITFIKKPVTLEEINDLPGKLLEYLNIDNNTKI